ALRHPPGKPEDVIGAVTNQLPVELLDAVLIYKGEVAALGRLAPNDPRQVSATGRVRFASWKNGEAAPAADGGPGATSGAAQASALQMSLLFHEEMAGSTEPHNGALRDVDESWRVSAENKD